MESYRRLCNDIGIQLHDFCSAIVATPRSGGRQLYFTVPDDFDGVLRPLDPKKYPGIDIISRRIKSNALVVAAGSTHRSVPGVLYEFLHDDPSFEVVPKELLKSLNRGVCCETKTGCETRATTRASQVTRLCVTWQASDSYPRRCRAGDTSSGSWAGRMNRSTNSVDPASQARANSPDTSASRVRTACIN